MYYGELFSYSEDEGQDHTDMGSTQFMHSSRLGQFRTYIKPVCIKKVATRTTFSIAGISYCTCNLIIEIQCTRYKNAFNKRC